MNKHSSSIDLSDQKIGFIGSGNMARSIIGGLIEDGIPPSNIHASDICDKTLSSISEEFSISTTKDNDEVISNCDVILLSVKPQIMKQVVETISITGTEKLVISIAAGIKEESLSKWLGGDLAIIRTMPNTPSLVRTGATGAYCNKNVSSAQKDICDKILSAIGITCWVDKEETLDLITAVSGSGPAYYFLVMEAMENAAVELGLPKEIANNLVIQTALGAAKIASSESETPKELRARVTSPNGTTEKGIQALEDGNIRDTFANAIKAAAIRSKELGEILGDQ